MQVCRHVRAVAEACVSSASVRVHQCVCCLPCEKGGEACFLCARHHPAAQSFIILVYSNHTYRLPDW